jgi:TPR repeat protein
MFVLAAGLLLFFFGVVLPRKRAHEAGQREAARQHEIDLQARRNDDAAMKKRIEAAQAIGKREKASARAERWTAERWLADGIFVDGKQAYAAKDYAEAARQWRRAADAGHADAMFNLAELYGNGRGVPQDAAEAARWFRKAVDAGSPSAMEHLRRLEKRLGKQQ